MRFFAGIGFIVLVLGVFSGVMNIFGFSSTGLSSIFFYDAIYYIYYLVTLFFTKPFFNIFVSLKVFYSLLVISLTYVILVGFMILYSKSRYMLGFLYCVMGMIIPIVYLVLFFVFHMVYDFSKASLIVAKITSPILIFLYVFVFGILMFFPKKGYKARYSAVFAMIFAVFFILSRIFVNFEAVLMFFAFIFSSIFIISYFVEFFLFEKDVKEYFITDRGPRKFVLTE